MRLGLLGIAAAALLSASPAAATDWRLITEATGPSGDTAYFLLDRDTIRREGDRAFGMLALVGPDFDLQAQIEFDCAAKRFRVVSGKLTQNGVTRQSADEGWQTNSGKTHSVLFDYACTFDRAAPDRYESLGAKDPVAAARARIPKK